jgi:anti-anti-sigma factor
MQISMEQNGDVLIVRVNAGMLTYPVLSPFFEEVLQIVEKGSRKLVIDLEAVSLIDSESIGCLIQIHWLLKDRAGALKVSALQPRVHTMLSMAGILRVLDVHGRTADALAAFAGPSGHKSG